VTGLKTPELEDDRQLEDMSTRELVQLMAKIQRMRWARFKALKELSADYREAKRNAVVTRAKAFLGHSGPQQERDQASRLAAADAEFAADAAKAALEACKEAMSLLKDDWDTCRSVNANERAVKNAVEGFGS
jgi:hypothetical protein